MKQGVMYQSFEWYTKENPPLWKVLIEQAKQLHDAGFTSIWLPPAYKGAQGIKDVGYGAYDLYDLGEFDAKGTIRTKYGTKDDYIKCIQVLQDNDIQVYTDIVLNHKMGADGNEKVMARVVNPTNREEYISNEEEIEAATLFTFPHRDKYSKFTWNWTHFNGVDYDNLKNKQAYYLFEGKTWNQHVDDEDGNYDYLMGADLDFSNEEVVNECISWGKWYIDTCHNDGFRLDAVKHIDSQFYKKWITTLRVDTNKELFTVGEYWHGDVQHLIHYLEEVDYSISLFDVPLHYHFYEASHGDYNMSQILTNTLLSHSPEHTITFVDNHDTQLNQGLESYVDDWFKPHAYALILLREEGYPCVFAGDYEGYQEPYKEGIKDLIDKMIYLRQHKMNHERYDYFDDSSIIGWSYKEFVVIMSHDMSGEKTMYVGEEYNDMILTDGQYDITIQNGEGTFICNEKSLHIYELKGA